MILYSCHTHSVDWEGQITMLSLLPSAVMEFHNNGHLLYLTVNLESSLHTKNLNNGRLEFFRSLFMNSLLSLSARQLF